MLSKRRVALELRRRPYAVLVRLLLGYLAVSIHKLGARSSIASAVAVWRICIAICEIIGGGYNRVSVVGVVVVVVGGGGGVAVVFAQRFLLAPLVDPQADVVGGIGLFHIEAVEHFGRYGHVAEEDDEERNEDLHAQCVDEIAVL